MPHLVLLIYLVSFASGIVFMTMAAFVYIKNRMYPIKYVILADLFFLSILFFDSLTYYSKLDGKDFPIWVYVVILYGLLFGAVGKMYYMLHITYYIIGNEFTKTRKTIFVICSVFSVGLLVTLNILYLEKIFYGDAAVQSAFFTPNIFTTIGTVYCVFLVFRQYKKIGNGLKPAVTYCLTFLCIFTPISFMINLLGYWVSTSLPIALSPLTYPLYNIVGIYYIGKYLFSETHAPSSAAQIVPNGREQIDFEYLENKYNITQREFEIIELVVNGCNNQEIGDKLFISPNTVKNHIYSIYKKLGVKNRLELTNSCLKYVNRANKV